MIAGITKTYGRHRDRPKTTRMCCVCALLSATDTRRARLYRMVSQLKVNMFADDAVVVALLTEDETRRCAHASEFFSCQIRQQFHFISPGGCSSRWPAPCLSFIRTLCVIAWCRALPIDRTSTIRMSAKTARQQQDGQHSFDLSGGERLLLS